VFVEERENRALRESFPALSASLQSIAIKIEKEKTYRFSCHLTFRPALSSFSPRPVAPADGQSESERPRARNFSPRIAKQQRAFRISPSPQLFFALDRRPGG
jgi:hypothetical protein